MHNILFFYCCVPAGTPVAAGHSFYRASIPIGMTDDSLYAVTQAPRCSRAATSAGGADAPVRWDSCRLDFFATFLVKQKSREESMNGRLYDPVIARFFSPDKYVANYSFTQDFNRYSYARNNPLMYTDPDGEYK